MSYSFYVKSRKNVSMRDVLQGLSVEGSNAPILVGEELSEGNWPKGRIIHCYLAGESARSVEVGRDGKIYDVRVLTCSNQADHRLAIALIERIAQLTNSQIQAESGESLDRKQLRKVFNAERIESMALAGPSFIVHMTEEDGSQQLQLSGAVRPYYFGPRTLERLRTAGPADELNQRILDDIVRVQNMDLTHLYQASTLSVSSPTSGDSFTLAVVTEAGCYLPVVDRYAFTTDDETVMVDSAQLSTVLDGQLELIDEAQPIVPPLHPNQWDQIVARAHVHAVPD